LEVQYHFFKMADSSIHFYEVITYLYKIPTHLVTTKLLIVTNPTPNKMQYKRNSPTEYN
jgi:hypothetical protein